MMASPLRTPISARRILLASLIGTTIEFFDFYIYATAAVLVFPKLFFPAGDAASGRLQSLATFALAFFARPVGSALFGHFGDRVGRKATLVTALLTMGVSTIVIGVLPTYASIGVWAPLALALCRLGQGIGLGGEWGGAVLLATENAPVGRRAWYGSFPQLGAPLGFLCSTGSFLFLGWHLSDAEFTAWGWRLPFLASALLVAIGLYIRLQLVETPEFERVLRAGERVRVPLLAVYARHFRVLVLGTLAATVTFVVFYLMTVFALSWATSALKIPRQQFLELQMVGVLFFGATIPVSALIADRIGSRNMLKIAALLMIGMGFCFAPLFGAASTGPVLLFLVLGFGLAGLTYGPLGSALGELFPTAVRYTGTSLTFNFAGILGASLAPYIATALALKFGIAAAGYYLSGVAAVSLVALVALGATVALSPPGAEGLPKRASGNETLEFDRVDR
jgi:metabolite-proton symporter